MQPLPSLLSSEKEPSHLTWEGPDSCPHLPLLCLVIFLLPGSRALGSAQGGEPPTRSAGKASVLSSIEDTSRILVNCLPCLLLSWKRFKWDAGKCEPHFSISPEEGYITAGMEVSFEVVYHPTEVGKESLYKNLLCFIQGGNPLSLTLSGVCVGPPAIKEVSRCCPGTGQGPEWAQQAPQVNSARPSRNNWLCLNSPQFPHQTFRPALSHHRAFACAIPTAGVFIFPTSFS